MKKILVICPRKRDYREFARPENIGNAEIVFHTFDPTAFRTFIYAKRDGKPLNPTSFLDDIITLARDKQVDAIVANEDYLGPIFASIASYELGLQAPSPEAMLTCQHKYHARVAQKKYAPEATPHFQLIDPQTVASQAKKLTYPIFAKPIKAFHSIGAEIIHSPEELEAKIDRLVPPAPFVKPLEWALEHYTNLDPRSDCLLVEELLEGAQTTVEGFAFGGQVTILGITDAFMYPGSLSRKQVAYPSQLSTSVQNRMATISQQCIEGIVFDHGLFNIDLMYNEKKDRIDIIEINPRMAAVYAHFHEHIDGTNSYKILCDIAQGIAPSIEKNKGKHASAASFIARQFEDKYVNAVPLEHDLEQIKQLFPDAQIKITAKQGHKLSEDLQDGKSYTYVVVDVVGNDTQELLNQYKQCMQLLPFSFETV